MLRAPVVLTILGAAPAVWSVTSQIAQPLSIPPSGYWDGNDGRWSTFRVSVGTPAQSVRLLPGTSATAGDSIWVVLEEGCSLANPGLFGCDDLRGNSFTRNQSTTWSTARLENGGLYGLDTSEESKLDLTGSAYYGFDTLQLDLPGSQLPNFTAHPIAGFATNDFWLGSLGLSPLPINFTSFDQPVPSLLGRLRNTSVVASSSWAYHAGGMYKDPPVLGSLTFGGYDSHRVQQSGISVPFGTDQSRDLLVGVQSITYDTLGSAPLLTTSVYAFIDSIVTHMWLPIAACRAFEQAFGLVWNDTSELYLLNDTAHAKLRAQNPTFTITLGSSASGGNTTTITLPYAAFDLNVTTSIGSVPYFPLKRAQNSTQYTLGRVFLQEAYVIADYDRKNFTIAQAAFPTGSAQSLQAILPPGFVVQRKSGLSIGAIAGIAVGGVLALVLLVLGLLLLRRRRRSQRHEIPQPTDKPSEGGEAFPANEKLSEDGKLGELVGSHEFQSTSELPVHETHGRGELHVSEAYARTELDGGGKYSAKPAAFSPYYELPAAEVPRVELDGEQRAASK